MMIPAKPADEAQRIETLHTLKVLDTAPEERFDRLTRLARRLFGVPIAVVSLVDSDRQWFKSSTGLDVTETPRDISFCGHAILGDDSFLVPDAACDDRFKDNPLVVEGPRIRFYAGCPLTAGNGSKLGTLCIIDDKPRELNEHDVALLHDLARVAEQELTDTQLATMDALTQLSNRRGFESLASRALDMCRRHARQASLLYFDLDLFKQINDNFGHAEGDIALVNFAKILKHTFRESDLVGRLGGDEFSVLTTNEQEDVLDGVIERLSQAVKQYNQTARRGCELAYSAGIAQFDAVRHPGIAELMAEADALMYEKKQKRSSLRGGVASHAVACAEA